MTTPTRSELRQAIEVSLELIASPPTAGELSVRELQAVPTAHGPTVVGVDGMGGVHLLLAVDGREHGGKFARGASVSASRRTLLLHEREIAFVDVACRVPHLRRLFSMLCTDILERIIDRPDDPEDIVVDALDEWRALLAKAAAPLDERRARGLFGELHQLALLLELDDRAVDCWRGPESGEHDLVRESLSIEVKSQARKANLVEINGLGQLAAPRGGELALVVQVVESRPDGTSLAAMVDRVATLARDRGQFFDRLALLGILRNDPALETFAFEVTDERWFSVDDGFPRLVSTDLVDGRLHPAIRTLSYVVDLSTASGSLDEAGSRAFRERMISC